MTEPTLPNSKSVDWSAYSPMRSPARSPARSPMARSPARSPVRSATRRVTPATSAKKRAHRKLTAFYRKSAYSVRKTKKKLEFACKDSAICLILGTDLDADLRKFFAGFVKFRFMAAATRLHKPSANGFVHQLRYTHHGYDAHAVLKSVIRPRADNAVYEFLVGTYINSLTKRFPCFVETYGLFKYNGLAEWTAQRDDTDVSAQECAARLKHVPYAGTTAALHAALHNACTTPERFAVLVQNIPSAIYVSQLPDEANLLPVLYQIYYPLGLLQAHFTHYDLHARNVLLYEPAPNKYIEYHYHTPEGVVRFKSNYLAKIIDYGRCFFDQSPGIYHTLLSLNARVLQCGFGWLNPQNSSKPFFTNSKPDPRHDLRFLQIVKEYLNPKKRSVFDLSRFPRTRALITPDFPVDYTGREASGVCAGICDCAGARDWVAQSMQGMPDLFQGQEKFGELHVRPDAPFVFTLA